ncbi:hypothetical protein [Halorussus caseinilyticus]|uniref:Uncharacterized protein n=1 Tax=Halorussus caseinilyticus TaxID=3034025 RepID=A0ABD5WRA5_9EURY
MTDASDYEPVECPVSDCTYRDAIRPVAAHVGRSDDDGHSWDRLGYGGARDFVETEKRRQQQADDGGQSGSSTVSDGANPTTDTSPTTRASDDAGEFTRQSGEFEEARERPTSNSGSSETRWSSCASPASTTCRRWRTSASASWPTSTRFWPT